MAQNSPARRIPSHGTELLGASHAIDFVAVDRQRRTVRRRAWRTFFATEPPELFLGFGRNILAPAAGVVVAVHDGEPDHAARRSQLALLPYALGQAGRLRQGTAAIAGNHVIIELPDRAGYLAVVHLREGSLIVSAGDAVATGQRLGQCGNSGNSTQPHVHIQLMDSLDLTTARGIPMRFRHFREWPRGAKESRNVTVGMPAEGSVVEPFASSSFQKPQPTPGDKP